MQLRKEAKIGRNDKCPCGSGKKYKRCCLIKKQIMEQEQFRREPEIVNEKETTESEDKETETI